VAVEIEAAQVRTAAKSQLRIHVEQEMEKARCFRGLFYL
jgi:hypothetical protein